MKTKLQKILTLSIVSAILLSISLFIFKDWAWESNKIKNNYNPLVKNDFLIKNENGDEDENKEGLKNKLGQNLIVGIPSFSLDRKTREILNYIKPAGIVLYRRNYKSEQQLEDLIYQLQEISNEDTGTFYFIMIDEEIGGATRLGLFKNAFPLGLPNWKNIKKDISVLTDIGVNVNLAPIADFPFNDDAFIKRRVPTKSIDDLIMLNRTFIGLLDEYNISSTLKHFPGMGFFAEDPHRELLYSDIQSEVLDESLKIFKDGIDHGADFVMTGHATYKNIDPNNAATFSSKIVENLLIEQLGFRGVIVTDDLSEMPLAIKETNRADAGIQALKAGHHLIMYSHNLARTKKIFDKILVKIENDPELQSIIKDNYQKIIDFKEHSSDR